jgi:hypothetical protein
VAVITEERNVRIQRKTRLSRAQDWYFACLTRAAPAGASTTDNDPPGCDIAYSQIRSCAAGAGTRSDPATFASDTANWPWGRSSTTRPATMPRP